MLAEDPCQTEERPAAAAPQPKNVSETNEGHRAMTLTGQDAGA